MLLQREQLKRFGVTEVRTVYPQKPKPLIGVARQGQHSEYHQQPRGVS